MALQSLYSKKNQPHKQENKIMTTETKRLVNDLKIIGRDTEDLIKATAGDLTEKTKEARSRLITAVESAKDTCLELKKKATPGPRTKKKKTQKNPNKSWGFALGGGFRAVFWANPPPRSCPKTGGGAAPGAPRA